MADDNSLTFWSEVATRYKGDGRVLFELYNEPHDVSWGVWKSGGDDGVGWHAAGMQQLHDAVRAAGAENLVIVGGLNWAFDLSGVPRSRISGHNIVYATHPYGGVPDRAPDDLGRVLGIPHRDRSRDRHRVRRRGRRLLGRLQRASSSPTPTCTPPAGPPGRGFRADAASRRSSPTGTEPPPRWARSSRRP